jgi:16S rRNA (uracil1498-N3)-methyltransferase
MHRFFQPASSFKQGEVVFTPEISRQMVRVLRLKVGQEVAALDNTGIEYTVLLERIGQNEAAGRITHSMISPGEPRLHLTLFIGLTQHERFEWILQKCTEVGAASLVPMVTERSLVQHVARAAHKRARWEQIIREAAEQSGRGRLPELGEPLLFENAVETAALENELALIPWEEENLLSLKNALKEGPPGLKKLALLIGPVGGFSTGEISKARARGILPVTLGERIFRVETAALIATALAFYELDEMETGRKSA